MVTINPFRALRPARENAKLVSSVPYDVVQAGEVRSFVAENPLSFLKITRAELEGEPEESAAERARANLQQFVESGVLVQDDEPAIYVYRLSTDTHVQTGVVACCSLDEYESGVIKKHEKTRPDKVKDRTSHMLAVRAQTGLIFLAFRGTEAIVKLIEATTHGQPLYEFTCGTGVRQTVWKVSDADPLVAAFREVDSLYIADGHHRAESACRVRKELQAANPDHTGAEPYNFVMAGMFPAEELQILAYNRTVSGFEDVSDDGIIERIETNFSVKKVGACEPATHGEICMYLGGGWYDLQLKHELEQDSDPIERLDVSILQRYVLQPVFAIEDPRTDKRIGFVGGAKGTAELERLVESGEARVAFSLYPTTMDDLFAVSDMGAIMPPKSTWFEPKLKDGLFVHVI